MSNDRPICPDCESPIDSFGECTSCEYDTSVVREIAPDENQAAVYGDGYKKETSVSFEVVCYEYSIASDVGDIRPALPFVAVTTREGKFPGGRSEFRFPMVSKWMPVENCRLQSVLLVDGHGWEPDIVGVYSDGVGADYALETELTSDGYEVVEYCGQDSLYGKVSEVLWDAGDSETKDPMHDIDLPNTEPEDLRSEADELVEELEDDADESQEADDAS